MTQAIAEQDVACHLHSDTNARRREEIGPLVIARREGPYVFDKHGKRYLGGMSGLFSVALGFSEQRLIDAATRQLAA